MRNTVTAYCPMRAAIPFCWCMPPYAAVAEFERDLLIERTQSGIIRAKAAGKQFGRPPAGVGCSATAGGQGTRPADGWFIG